MMLLQEPVHSPYDLQFRLLGFPVRVAWSFWLVGVMFGYRLVQDIDFLLIRAGDVSPGMIPLLVLWTLSIFVSILIHEIGHAIAFRCYGFESSIVLYHFGGLAIPRRSSSYQSSSDSVTPLQQIVISFAGPFAQIFSAFVVGAIVVAMGYRLIVLQWMPSPFQLIPGVMEGKPLLTESPGLFAIVTMYLLPSVLWALLNLLPVWPLDGGRIARAVIVLFGGNLMQALWVSVIAAALCAAYGFANGQQYLGIMFLILGVSSFQAIRQLGGMQTF